MAKSRKTWREKLLDSKGLPKVSLIVGEDFETLGRRNVCDSRSCSRRGGDRRSQADHVVLANIEDR